MSRACNLNIRKALELSEALIALANKGDQEREDLSCGLLYAVARDAAYGIMKQAWKEYQVHKAKGVWDLEDLSPSRFDRTTLRGTSLPAVHEEPNDAEPVPRNERRIRDGPAP